MKLALRRTSTVAPGARNARRSWPERASLLLRLTDARGHSGLGEASPLPRYSSESLEEVEAWLRGFDPKRLTVALESPNARQALALTGALAPFELPSARMALETAVLDLLGQRQRTPAHALLEAEGAARPVSALLGVADAPGLAHDARRAVENGYRSLKLKLGAAGRLDAELQGLERLRDAVGPEPALRLDANGALSARDLERLWSEVRAIGVELFEEPGPSSLPRALPLALDESLQGLSPAEALTLAQKRAARAVVLKPMVLGGLAHCLELAEAAGRAGLGVVVSHAFDGPCGFAAAATLALALPAGLAHGLAPHAALGAWRERAPVDSGKLRPWVEPGLGLQELEGTP